MLTIFTATYNRAYILPELYQSLKEQTDRDFEWIIVDDGSTDNTKEYINSLEKVGQGIFFYEQEHGGKHRAINLGVQKARGEYFFIVDSDDKITPDAVEKVNAWTGQITDADSKIAGVAGTRFSRTTGVWGGDPLIPQGEYIEAGNTERAKYNLMGDKAEVYSIQVLRQHPFPEFEGEMFVTEAVVWDSIAMDGYKLRWYDEPIYECEYLSDGLTQTGANDTSGHLKNPKGFAKYVEVEMRAQKRGQAIALFREYEKVADTLGLSIGQRAKDLNLSPAKYYLWRSYSLVRKTGGFIIRTVSKIRKKKAENEVSA